MATADELLSDVLQLPSKDRARLAHELLRSLDEQAEEPEAEDAWAQELERRAQDVISGNARTYDAREVIEEVRAQLRGRRGG